MIIRAIAWLSEGALKRLGVLLGVVTGIAAAGEQLIAPPPAHGSAGNMWNYERTDNGDRGHAGTNSFEGTFEWANAGGFYCGGDLHPTAMYSYWVGTSGEVHGHACTP
jgi:hypothetical protein